MSGNPFEPDVISAICHHMNTDHVDDTLTIVRGAGGVPEADSARMTGFDGTGADFEAMVDGEPRGVRIPWAETISARPQVRPEIVRLFGESVATLRNG